MSMDQPRDPAGRWGNKTGSNPDRDVLGVVAVAERDDDDETWQDDDDQIRLDGDDEIWHEVLAPTQRSARAAARRKQVDADEVEGRVLAAFAAREAKQPGWLRESIEEHGSMAGYVSTCCRNAAYRIANSTHTDRETRARAELNRREIAHNGPVDFEQRSAWIDDIEAETPGMSSRWHGSNLTESLDNLTPSNEPKSYDNDASGDPTGDAADVYEAARAAGTSEWGALVHAVGAPQVAGKHLAEEQAAKLRVAAEDAGGVGALIDRWKADEMSEDDTYVLFNPWGAVRERKFASEALVSRWSPPSFDQQDEIVDFLTRYGDAGTDKMWNAAVSDASWAGKRRSRGRGSDDG